MSDLIFLESSFRSFLIALLAVIFGAFISRILYKRLYLLPWIICPLFLCFFIPPVAVAYGYSNLSFKLIQSPFLLNSLYVLIMTSRLTAPVTILLFLVPTSLSPEGLHCYKLLRDFSPGKRSITKYMLFLARGSLWRFAVAYILVYMLAFSEFELASLMNVEHWSVSVFDSYAQGISSLRAIRLHSVPFLLQGILLIVFLSVIPNMKQRELFDGMKNISYPEIGLVKPLSQKSSFNILYDFRSFSFLIVFTLTLTFLFVGVLFPAFKIIKSAIPGFLVLLREFWMLKELIASLLFAFTATLLGYIFAFVFSLLWPRKRLKKLLLLVFIPGVIGILPLSLIVLRIFQLPFLNKLYDSPLPLLTVLTIWCLPFVISLQIIFNAFTGNESIHSARLLLNFSRQNAMELLWKFKFRGALWIFFFVFTLTYFDLTASAILAPASMTTITARFYNLMHYGESEKLSATVCLSIIVPLLLFLVISLFLRVFIKRCNAFSKSG